MKENLERTWRMMLLLYCSLAALVVTIITTRFLIEALGEGALRTHLLDFHWGMGLSLAALIALRMACPLCSSPPRVLWRFWVNRAADLILIASAILLPASGVSMTLWSGQDIEFLGHVLVVAGPYSAEMRSLSLVLHEIAAVFLTLSLVGRLILALAFADQGRIQEGFR